MASDKRQHQYDTSLFRLANLPLVPTFQLSFNLTSIRWPGAIDHLTAGAFRRLCAHQTEVKPNQKPAWLNWRTCLLLAMLLFLACRCWAMVYLYQDDRHWMVTILGSIFHLTYAERKYPEMTAFNFSISNIVLLYIVYGRRKWNLYFRLIVHQCQLLVSGCHRKGFLGLPAPVLSQLQRQTLQLFRLESVCNLIIFCNVFITMFLIVLVGDPDLNNYGPIFDRSPVRYYLLYGVGWAWFWAIWAFSGISNSYGIFVHFLIHARLLKTKVDTNRAQLTDVVNRLRQYRSGALLTLPNRRLQLRLALNRHLREQARRFDEIRQASSFWRQYLSCIHLSSNLQVCYALYVAWMTDAMLFFKVFFLLAFSPLLFVLVATIVASSRLFDAVSQYYQRYIDLMVITGRGHNQFLDCAIKLKVSG